MTSCNQNPDFRSASVRAAIDRLTTEGDEQSRLSRRNTRYVAIQSQLSKEKFVQHARRDMSHAFAAFSESLKHVPFVQFNWTAENSSV